MLVESQASHGLAVRLDRQVAVERRPQPLTAHRQDVLLRFAAVEDDVDRRVQRAATDFGDVFVFGNVDAELGIVRRRFGIEGLRVHVACVLTRLEVDETRLDVAELFCDRHVGVIEPCHLQYDALPELGLVGFLQRAQDYGGRGHEHGAHQADADGDR